MLFLRQYRFCNPIWIGDGGDDEIIGIRMRQDCRTFTFTHTQIHNWNGLHNNSDGWHSLLRKLYQFTINQATISSPQSSPAQSCWLQTLNILCGSAIAKLFYHPNTMIIPTKCTYKSISHFGKLVLKPNGQKCLKRSFLWAMQKIYWLHINSIVCFFSGPEIYSQSKIFAYESIESHFVSPKKQIA